MSVAAAIGWMVATFFLGMFTGFFLFALGVSMGEEAKKREGGE